jgi:glycosyltransferase involved in cell wall biosynthesis
VAASADGAFGGPASGARSDIHFALIVTGWNCEKLADACLASIMGQIPGGYTLSIQVYEDGSDDGTWRVVERKSNVLNLRAVRGERNMGPAFARDRLLRQVANGDDICVLVDMDDELLPHALRDLENIYRANPDCWMTYGNWVNQNGRINDEGVYSAAEIDSRAYRALDVFRFTHLRSFRRFLYDRVDEAHLKDEEGEWLRYCSDVGLMLPIADQCASRNVVALQHPVYRYRQYQATGTQKRFGGDRKREVFRYLRGNPDLFRYVE